MAASPTTSRGWLSQDDCRLEDFIAVVEQVTDLADYPYADAVADNALVYDSDHLRKQVDTADGRREVQAELARALTDGPGMVVFQGAFPDRPVVDRATDAFDAMIAEQRASGAASGDHFAKPGANDRVWNALEKLAVREPDVVRRLLRQRHPRPGQHRVARSRPTRSPARSTWSTPAARRRARTGTTTSGS